jgi:decaprenylphospho-beta-D-erythro-pentofuranosid-2-ulose 2-reductase
VSKGPVLILGGASDIGLAIARRFAEAGHPIQLAARRPDELQVEKSDIALRHGVSVTVHPFDVLDTDAHEAFIAGLPELPEVAVCVVGLLGEQSEAERTVAAAVAVMRTNYEGPASLLGVIANHFERRGSGTIVGISSAAGDRGRAVNYVYGSAKAGFTAFLSGLRNRLARKGVHVVTVKPGFVATQMTAGMNLPKALTARPDEVAKAVIRAVQRKANVIYVRPIWRIIMSAICSIPERVFKRTRI